ncbi:MAG TPA: hypothetical protein DCE71_05445 [Parachlamydiales bacterium]|nr:hypothetical protein [Parachlamydiales bacterium]
MATFTLEELEKMKPQQAEAPTEKQVFSLEELESLPPEPMPEDIVPSNALQVPIEAAAKNAANIMLLQQYPQASAKVKELFGGKDYVQERDAELNRLYQLEQDEPVASGVGKGLGLAAQFITTPIFGLGKTAAQMQSALEAGKGMAGVIGPAAKSLATGLGNGSAYSLARNPGDNPGQVAGLQVEERLKNVKEDLPLNLAASALGVGADVYAAKKAASGAKEFIGDLKPRQAQAEVFIQNEAKRAKELADFAMRNKIARIGASPEDMMNQTRVLRKNIGERIGDFVKTNADLFSKNRSIDDIFQNPVFDPEVGFEQLRKTIESNLVQQGVSGASDLATKVAQKAASDYETLLRIKSGDIPKDLDRMAFDEIGDLGLFIKNAQRKDKASVVDTNLDAIHLMKRMMQGEVSNYDKLKNNVADSANISQAYDLAAKFFDNKFMNAIEKLGGDKAIDQYKKLKKEFSLASDFETITQRKAAQDFKAQSSAGPLYAGGATYAGATALGLPAQVSIPAGVAMAGASRFAEGLEPATKYALSQNAPQLNRGNMLPKAASLILGDKEIQPFDLAKESVNAMLFDGVPGFEVDKQIAQSPLKPTEKAKLRKMVTSPLEG